MSNYLSHAREQKALGSDSLTRAAEYSRQLMTEREKLSCAERLIEARYHPSDKVREVRTKEVAAIRRGESVPLRTAKEILGE